MRAPTPCSCACTLRRRRRTKPLQPLQHMRTALAQTGTRPLRRPRPHLLEGRVTSSPRQVLVQAQAQARCQWRHPTMLMAASLASHPPTSPRRVHGWDCPSRTCPVASGPPCCRCSWRRRRCPGTTCGPSCGSGTACCTPSTPSCGSCCSCAAPARARAEMMMLTVVLLAALRIALLRGTRRRCRLRCMQPLQRQQRPHRQHLQRLAVAVAVAMHTRSRPCLPAPAAAPLPRSGRSRR